VSTVPTGPGSWQASDGRWYPAEQHPQFRPAPPTAVAAVAPAVHPGRPATGPVATTTTTTTTTTNPGARRPRRRLRQRRNIPRDVLAIVLAGAVGYVTVRLVAYLVNRFRVTVVHHLDPSSHVATGPYVTTSMAQLVAVVVAVVVAGATAVWIATTAWRPAPGSGLPEPGTEDHTAVAERLDRLHRKGFVVLRDLGIPRSSARIEFLAIGPPGVFVVDATFRTGAITVDKGVLRSGRQRVVTRTTAFGAEEVLRTLAANLPPGMPVQPVLCVVGTPLPCPELVIDGVRVISGTKHLSRALTSGPTVLDPASVHRLVDVVRRELGS